MSYLETETWTLRPLSAFRIKRNCPKCNCKTDYVSTENFRINANGRCVDLWLIYQCEHCKSTYNLPVYERIRPERLAPGRYRQLMENDSRLALEIGVDRALFERNRAVISDSAPYEIIKSDITTANKRTIYIKNPYHLKIRLDSLLADGLSCSRSQIKRDIEAGKITCTQIEPLEKAYIADGIEIIATGYNSDHEMITPIEPAVPMEPSHVSSAPDSVIDNADHICQNPSDGHRPPDAGDTQQRHG